MQLDKIFKHKKDKEEAISHFRNLKDNPDWKFLNEKIIQANVTDLTDKLLNPNTKWPIDELEESDAKLARLYWMKFGSLPVDMIETLSEENTGVSKDYDPYPKNYKELKEPEKKP